MARFCEQCGGPASETGKFCGACGSALTAQEFRSSGPSAEQTPEAPPPAPLADSPSQPAPVTIPNGPWSKALIRPAIALGVIAVLGSADWPWALLYLGLLVLAAVAWVPRLGPLVLDRVGWRRLPRVGQLSGARASLVLLGLILLAATANAAIRPSVASLSSAEQGQQPFATVAATSIMSTPAATAAAATLPATATPVPTRIASPASVVTAAPTPTPRPSFEPSVGSQARLTVGEQSTVTLIGVAATPDALDALGKAQYANDSVGVQQLLQLGRVVAVPDKTKVLVIDLHCSGFLCFTSAYQVRMLEGAYVGQAGWVRGEELAAP